MSNHIIKNKDMIKKKNDKYYNNRGFYIHKLIYYKKHYCIPNQLLPPDEKYLSTDELKILYNKLRVYVDNIKLIQRNNNKES